MPEPIDTYKWWLVAALWFVCLLNYADRQAISSLFPLLHSTLRLSDVQLGIVGSSFMWVYASFGPVAGWMGDRMSRRRLIVAGLLLWIVLEFATSLAHTYTQLTSLRALSGLGEAFYFPSAMALISSYHGARTRSRALALHQSAVYIGSVAGGSLAGILGQAFGWRSNFLFFGSVGIPVAAAVLLTFRNAVKPPIAENLEDVGRLSPAEPKAGFLQSALSLLRDRDVVLLIGVFMGANFVAMAFFTWLPSFLHAKFHMSLAMSGVSANLYLQTASVGGVLSGGFLADRLATRYSAGRMLTQALGLMGGVVFLFFIGWASTLIMLIAALIGFGYCKGIYDANIFASLYDVVPERQRSSAAGLLNSLGWLGGGFAPVALAYGSRRFTMSACLSATSLVYLLCGGVLLYRSRSLSASGRRLAATAKQ